ncbi:MAG: ATP phosphoribosyltransferase regulatory subunit [Alphaproteobacteria bacterium]|nr:ATP phosphoribosyltransferase regulatory subunit [Alphaproteobacteria bacterium]
MVAETATKFQALEQQAQTLMSVFTEAGYEAVAPAVIQPADVFLDVIGESLRARTYLFIDPEGEELCLRPDLTVPTGRLHIARDGEENVCARYCYNGVAFRFQPILSSPSHPIEFRQAGIETFADQAPEQTEADTVATIAKSLAAAGLTDFKLRIGDLGLFSALLEAADMPERWRQRLLRQFWRPEAFRSELKRLSADQPVALKNLPDDLMQALKDANEEEAEQRVSEHLAESGIDVVGVRTSAEIAASLMSMIEDSRSDPLPADTAALIESYVGVTAPARAAGARLRDLTRSSDIDLSKALDVYHQRLDLLHDAGTDVVHAEFSAEFGRSLEYYTGFVFEIFSPALGAKSPIAGGGRYDNLMQAAGAKHAIPAVGGAIHTERLLVAVAAEAS